MSEKNRALIRRLHEAWWNTGDLAAVEEIRSSRGRAMCEPRLLTRGE